MASSLFRRQRLVLRGEPLAFFHWCPATIQLRADPGRVRETHQSFARQAEWCVSRTLQEGRLREAPHRKSSRLVYENSLRGRVRYPARGWRKAHWVRGGRGLLRPERREGGS